MSAGNAILIVDDDFNVRESLSMILQRRCDQVTCAGNAAEALQCLRTGPYYLAFLDIKLPDANGMALLPEIRRQYPDMPVVMLTGQATLETAVEAIGLGARGYLPKPVSPEQLLQLADEAFAEQKQRQRTRDILAQTQALLAELSHIGHSEAPSTPAPAALSPADSARFLNCGAIALDLHARLATLHHQSLALSARSFDFLAALLRHSPDTVPYQALVSEAQGDHLGWDEARRVSRWRIFDLRKSLEEDSHEPRLIQTVRGVGYRLVA